MVGRFTGSAIMQKFRAPRLLRVFAGDSLLWLLVVVVASGATPVWAIVLSFSIPSCFRPFLL
jgi:FHS family L-fucose permease-like MFS transporter